MKYHVTLVKMLSFGIEVEADDEDGAVQEAYENTQSICAQCGGWGQKWSLDDDGDWQTIEEFYGESYDPERDGRSVEAV